MSNKIKILILNEPEGMGGVTHWRMYRPMLMLESMYADQVEIIWNRGMLLPVDMARADVAIAWRPSTAAQLNVLAQVRSLGIRIIIDHDDDLLNVPSGSPAFLAYYNTGHIIKQIISLADMVWTSTDVLKEVYRHPVTAVIPNAVLPTDIIGAPNPITKTVVWRGDYNHHEDVYAGMSDYFKVARNCKRFVWIGYMPTWEHADHVEFLPWASVTGYFSHLRHIKPNFLWKPMRKNLPFNHGKSNIAKIEAICAGAVALTNFYDQPEWKHSFRNMEWDEKQIHGAWEAGRDEIVERYNLESWTHVRYRLINEVLNLGS